MEPITILVFILLLFFSAFFAGSEIAIMSLPAHTVEAFVKKRRLGADILQKLKKDTDKLLITVLIGNNLLNTLMASLATKIAIDMAQSSGFQETFAIGISTGIITFLILTFGEIVPKSLGAKHAGTLALYCAYPLKIFAIVLMPIVYIFERIIKLFTGTHTIPRMTDEEMESFIDLGKNNGALDDGEHERIKGILELGDITAQDIMTPRVNITALKDTASLEYALQFFLEHNHSRIPVYSETVDKILGFITLRDIVAAPFEGNSQKKISEIHIHQVLKIPLNQPLDTLFELFQNNQKHIAVVIDEYGGVAGIITLEDIFEEVFGEIRDETDKETDNIQQKDTNTYTIDSSVMIDDILEEFELELENIGFDVAEFSTETVSYILTHTLERFPEVGEVVTFSITKAGEPTEATLEFRVLDMIETKIGKIEVKLHKKISEEISEKI